MSTRTTVMGIFAVTIAVTLVLGWWFPTMGDIDIDHTETETYQNTGPFFALTDESGTAHTISCTLSDGMYYVTTDGETARTMEQYVAPTRGIAPAIGIGVYKAYDNNGVLISRAGVNPTTTHTLDEFRTLALAGNTDVTAGTYQLWNYYQYTLNKLMSLTVMGNTDSQYIMGSGIVSSSKMLPNGLTDSAYTVSTSKTTAVCLFIENSWGNINEFIGDTYQNNYILSAGNTLGGNALADVESTLSQTVTIPSANGTVGRIYYTSDSIGTPRYNGSGGNPGEAINDAYTVDTGYCTVGVSGRWAGNMSAGLFCYYANNPFDYGADRFSTRLAYVMTEGEQPTADYGYKIQFAEVSNKTIISDVQVQTDEGWVSCMPDGTTLNDFWSFNPDTGVGPFGAYYVAINLASGSNNDDTEVSRISTEKGEVAYRLNPYNLKQTLEGYTYSPSQYNIMLVIPTVYWYTDTDAKEVYMSNTPDRFNGITMRAYAHEYTIDPDVDTGNPPKAVYYESDTIAVGNNGVLALYENGDVRFITSDDTIQIGNASDTVEMTLTNGTLTYTGGTAEGIELYAVATGEYVACPQPSISNESEIWIGEMYSTMEGTVGYLGRGMAETLSVIPLDPTDGYDTTVLHMTKEVLNEKAVKISTEVTTSWSGGIVVHQCDVIAPAEVTVEYPVSGLSGVEMKIVLAMGVLIVAGILVFCIRFL